MSNPYQGRWRWWYSAIADWMIRNPGGSMRECAAELNKAYATICFIASTDLFKDYLAQRKAEWQEGHDAALRSKLTRVAESSLDAILERVQKQGDKVPIDFLTEVATSSLDRLGFGPKKDPPSVNVQVNNLNQPVVLPSVSPLALEEARAAMRRVESQRAEVPMLELVGGVVEAEAPAGESEAELEIEAIDVSDVPE